MVSEEIAGLRLVRLRGPGGRVAVGAVAGDEVGALEAEDVVATLQAGELPVPTERVALLDAQACIPAEPWRLLAPLVAPETWAAGVTYERSREARVHESDVADVYDRVYGAERPELFLKDAGACALGPALLVPLDWSVPFDIELRILDPAGETVFVGRTSTASMCRSIDELIEFLCRDNPVPGGTVLLTGTGVVPPDGVMLEHGQSVEITISGIGTLRNPVGANRPASAPAGQRPSHGHRGSRTCLRP